MNRAFVVVEEQNDHFLIFECDRVNMRQEMINTLGETRVSFEAESTGLIKRYERINQFEPLSEKEILGLLTDGELVEA